MGSRSLPTPVVCEYLPGVGIPSAMGSRSLRGGVAARYLSNCISHLSLKLSIHLRGHGSAGGFHTKKVIFIDRRARAL